ncbi:MAG: hypothetical protein IT359_15475 [Gemmatimonadaceae bacterium]|nr:hypothetical protein [Gemmatimonadaceae bacterium]
MRRWFALRLAVSAVALVTLAESAQGQGLMDKLKKAAKGKTYTVRGRLRVQDGQWLTCFEGIKTGYLGPANLSSPAISTTDPTSGRVSVRTAAIPTIIMTQSGVVTSNDCDSLAAQQLLLPPAPEGKSADTGYTDDYGCTKREWTKDEVIAHRREIMDCQADSITERTFRRNAAKGSGAAAAGGAGATTDTAALAAKFKAIQSQAATPPTPASARSAESLAADGAKTCGLTPAFMLKLRSEAVVFVRYDAAKGVTVLSELSGGERRTVQLDGNAFAQRMTFNAQSIAQGGDACGRAFWNAEAYKAASAAMSGG